MKTTWSIDTVAKKSRDWSNDKRKEFESMFPGIHWTSYQSHGKVIFHPTWHKAKKQGNQELEQEILEMVFGTGSYYQGVTFLQMYKGLKKRFTLKEIIATSLYLVTVKEPIVTSVIGRTGFSIGLRRLLGERHTKND